MSLVVPAYNEKDRLGGMLEEAVNYLERMYGMLANGHVEEKAIRQRKNAANGHTNSTANGKATNDIPQGKGWEIVIVSDGSTDNTEEMAFSFARDHQLSLHPKGYAGPWTPKTQEGVHIPPGTIRVVSLAKNRGKGGAVTHGMRHARGQYVIFADADGATNFEDLGKLVKACQDIEDTDGRGVAVGSRAHMVGSEAVVKVGFRPSVRICAILILGQRSKLRNFLMHSFHLILWLLTPSKTATIKDTQCGFKLFSRASLPYIIPNMHSEGWIFDVEMLMLAEFSRIPVAEVPVDWREVGGSKLNVLRDSIGMAWGLAVLRAAWSLGVYRRT
jgi:dolichyl-phosphate beta-glucosyltransferase